MTWFDILKGGSLRLHFPSFKRAVLEWNETQQVGNEDKLENMLKEIQPIYEEFYFSHLFTDVESEDEKRELWRTGNFPTTEKVTWRGEQVKPYIMNLKRRVVRNANKKVPMAKQALSNILHNNGWIKKKKHNTKTIDEKWGYGYKPIGTVTESIGVYEKVK